MRQQRIFDGKRVGCLTRKTWSQVADDWKVLVGLRYDQLQGNYDNFRRPCGNLRPATQLRRGPLGRLWSPRFGVLYQPNARP